jgi:outer membrane immunogenic protein
MRMVRSVTQSALVASVGALIASAVSAADLPAQTKAKPAPIAALTSADWTGFYLGLYAGLGVQRSEGGDPTGITGPGGVEFIGQGFTGGGTAGYNYQLFPNWVVGLEGDFGYLGLDRAFTDYFPDQRINSKTSWIGTVRARVGYSDGPTLSYLTGGAAWVHTRDVNDFTVFGGPRVSRSETNGGFAVGTGVETRLSGNWTAKAEQLYVDVGEGPAVPRGVVRVDKHRYDLMKFGVNYLFGNNPQPVLASHNWTGAYAGFVGGTAVSSTEGSNPLRPRWGVINNNGNGFTAGGIAGYNWHLTPHWVVGAEGDFSWLGIDHRSVDYFDSPAELVVETSWIATARARVGYSTGAALIYLTGGAAWVDVRDSFRGSPFRAGGPLVASAATLTGATIGGGIEAPSFIPGFMSRTEYLFVSAGTGNTVASDSERFRADHDFHLFRFALVHNFGAGWN